MEALSLPRYVAKEYLPSHLSLTRWPLSGVFDTHKSQAVALGLVQFLELNDACECVLHPWGAATGAKCSPPNGWIASCSALHLPLEGTGKWSSEPLGVRGLPADSATISNQLSMGTPEVARVGDPSGCQSWGPSSVSEFSLGPGLRMHFLMAQSGFKKKKKQGKIVLTWWDSG